MILERTVGSLTNGENPRHLRLMMLGCEDKPPYGPYEHTANLFMDLICKTLQEISYDCWIVSITIYRVKEFEYPATTEEWASFDGILLPGSFSGAYEKDDWIETLRQVIIKQVYEKSRPTLGICFGHQVMAHAFPDGEATKCPAGAQAGRKSFALTKAGSDLMVESGDCGDRPSLDLYYTHGDMVQQLPSCAVSLGGNEQVPIEAAAYYRSEQQVSSPDSRPIAITFQAHPEYASAELGLHKTLGSILEAMQARGNFSKERREELRQDAIDSYPSVERDSINVMKRVGILLGWFPEK